MYTVHDSLENLQHVPIITEMSTEAKSLLSPTRLSLRIFGACGRNNAGDFDTPSS